jgi:N-acetylmuramoyl-L-alanine amidase
MSGARLKRIVRVAMILIIATLFLTHTIAAKPTDPAPPPVTSAPANLPAPVAYPTVTPASTLLSHSISELRHLKTATGSPRLPSPNPWFTLDLYQSTLTRQEFEQKLHTLYDPFSALSGYLDINDQRVVIYPSPTERKLPQFTLQFAPPHQPGAPMRWFRTPEEFRAESRPLEKPLNGLRVAIDPGHIGGPWAQIEERSTRYNHSAPVQEGDLNLITARILKQQLTDLGASVFVVRDSTEPVTPYRPEDMMPFARDLLLQHAQHSTHLRGLPPDKLNLLFGSRVLELAEFLFYRCSEIVERGNRIRNNFVPDITITLYLDATPGSARGHLTSANSNIFFVHGCYTRAEMADPEMQLRCIYKMSEGSSDIESEVAADIAAVFKQRTNLPPVEYGDSATTRMVIPDNYYVVARDLAANREYDGPVVCTEPYFMNNRVVYQRLLAGDYDGQQTFDGKKYGSIFREYADCVTQGLLKAYAGPTVIAGATNPVAPAGHPK